MSARVAAALVSLDALAIIISRTFEAQSETVIVAHFAVIAVLGLATTVALGVLAARERTVFAITGAALWSLWWLMDAAYWLWAIRTTLGATLAPPRFPGLLQPAVGALAGLAVAVAAMRRGRQRGRAGLVAIYIGFAIAWFIGQLWLRDLVDEGQLAELTRFSDIAFVGWHVALALLLWRSAARDLPRARIAS